MEPAMRKDVPVELTWDLTLLYPTEEAMLADFAKAKELTTALVDGYKGKLTTADAIVTCLNDFEEIQRLLYLVLNYTDLAVSVDYYNTHNMEVNSKVGSEAAQIFSDLSFIEVEICQASDEVLAQAVDLAKGCKVYLKNILTKKPHQLSPETEKVLAALSPITGAPYQIYNMSKLADMKFPSFRVNGTEYPLGYSLFEDDYSYALDTDLRRTAFDRFSEKLHQYENTTAAVYNTYVTHDKIMANLRGYDSVFDYLLADQKVTREMYDRQIDLITEKLAPHMRKYAKLIQKIHGLDKMTFADLKMALDPEYDPQVTIPQAKENCKKGLACLGEDYVAMVEEAFTNRWIDFAKNQGKSTGGFCASPYGKNSFILLSWNDRMADCMTIAHELGHAGHFRSCNSRQSVFDTDVSRYFVEAPSTMNELLMANYLISTSDDKRFRRWVLSCMVGNTYYHNFVTHLREAWYQREVYRIIDAGGSVTADVLSDIYRRNLELFWGDAVEINDGAELTWMRQPHYYMGLYSYTYSAGLTVATQVSKRILAEGQTAVDDWKKVLAAGSTLDPVGLAALAKIDITTDEPLKDTIEYIGSLIDEICRLTEELEA